MKYYKVNAQGNSFVVFDTTEKPLPKKLDLSEIAVFVCSQSYGIGADGMVIIKKSRKADVGMRIFNADGSEAENCGSALRCIAAIVGHRYVFSAFTVETKAGVMLSSMTSDRSAATTTQPIPQFVFPKEIEIQGCKGMMVSTGNPHFVILTDKPLHDNPLVHKMESIAADPFFRQGINVHLAYIAHEGLVHMIPWERGVGFTLACGTGALAVAYTCMKKKLVEDPVTVSQPGGFMMVMNPGTENDALLLIGPVSVVATGEIDLKYLMITDPVQVWRSILLDDQEESETD